MMTALLGAILGTLVLLAVGWLTWETRRKMQVHAVRKTPWQLWGGMAAGCALILFAALALI